MNVIVFDVAAETGGAIEILNSFYSAAAQVEDINFKLILSTPIFHDTGNIHVKNYFWIKKSWLHRLVFDKVVASKLCRKKSVDIVVSLQNICIPVNGKKQILYIHQSIPFSNIKFDIFNNRIEWIYKNLISHLIFHSIRKADKIVVQTKWMRDAICKRTGVKYSNILVVQPECKVKIGAYYEDNEKNRCSFFYPATYNSYKNHKVIFEAARILIERGITGFQIVLTINMLKSTLDCSLSEMQQIVFLGSLAHDDVMRQYSMSTLIFPSKLETFGLPLLEAALVRSRIIASDMPFSHEILDGYPNASFFEADSAEALADLMELQIMNKAKYETMEDNRWYDERNCDIGWSSMFDVINKIADIK